MLTLRPLAIVTSTRRGQMDANTQGSLSSDSASEKKKVKKTKDERRETRDEI